MREALDAAPKRRLFRQPREARLRVLGWMGGTFCAIEASPIAAAAPRVARILRIFSRRDMGGTQKRPAAVAAAAAAKKKEGGSAGANKGGAEKPARSKSSKAKRSSCPCWCATLGITLLLGAIGGGIAAYRYRYPSTQRCPPEGDRFFDHCKEGRTHYLLKLNWTCFGPRKAEVMRTALSLDTGGKPLVGVGEVPSWLTDENAVALRDAPCMIGVEDDKACWHCKPSPKPTEQSNAELREKLRAAGGSAGDDDDAGAAATPEDGGSPEP